MNVRDAPEQPADKSRELEAMQPYDRGSALDSGEVAGVPVNKKLVERLAFDARADELSHITPIYFAASAMPGIGWASNAVSPTARISG